MHFALAIFTAPIEPSKKKSPFWNEPVVIVEFQLLSSDNVLNCNKAVLAEVVASKVNSPLYVRRFASFEVRYWRVAIEKGRKRRVGCVVRKEGIAGLERAAGNDCCLSRFNGSVRCCKDSCSNAVVIGLTFAPS